MIQKGYKFRIYPNKEQEIFLMKSFGSTRFIYNWALAFKNQEYTNTKKSSNYYELNKKLPELKKEFPWLTEIYSQTIQSSLRNLDNAFTRFFKKQGKYPRFKSKNKNDFSFQIPQGASIFENKLFIPKVKDGIKIKIHRQFEGKIKTVTISKNAYEQYFVTLLVETIDGIKPSEEFNVDKIIGIDLGIKEFAVLSNGERIENPKLLRKKLKRLKKIQKRHSRKVKGSNNRKKYRLKLAKIHLKIKNQRGDFLHKLTYYLTHKDQVSSIVIEDLAVSNMIKNHKLAQSISDVWWGEFRRQLEYKCKWYGKNLIVISRFAPSSKLCSSCGQLNDNLTLADREWMCDCGAIHDRDLNAAKNIKNFGIEQYRRNYGNSDACGENGDSASSMKQEAQAL
jgi:putative transposase